jgi:hypothetical protein
MSQRHVAQLAVTLARATGNDGALDGEHMLHCGAPVPDATQIGRITRWTGDIGRSVVPRGRARLGHA